MRTHQEGFIPLLIAAIVAVTGIGVGAAVYVASQQVNQNSVLLIDDTNTKQAASLQLKSLIPITTTPQPTQPPNSSISKCEYDGNGPGREGEKFDEPEILIDYSPKPPRVAGPTDSITLWLGDENSIVMGLASVDGRSFPISVPNGISTVNNPQIGAPYDQGGTDDVGRPFYPALFLTDITTDPNSRSGDWQQGGTPIPPHFLSGVWIISDKTGSKANHQSMPSSKNVVNTVWNLAAGGVAPEAGKSYEDKTYYGTEVRWNIQQLLATGKVAAGKRYRAQFMAHDGDDTSDVAQGCVTIQL